MAISQEIESRQNDGVVEISEPFNSVGYSAPTQSGITADLGLSLSEYSVFGSIATIAAMVGAVTSDRIADFVGRKWDLHNCFMELAMFL